MASDRTFVTLEAYCNQYTIRARGILGSREMVNLVPRDIRGFRPEPAGGPGNEDGPMVAVGFCACSASWLRLTLCSCGQTKRRLYLLHRPHGPQEILSQDLSNVIVRVTTPQQLLHQGGVGWDIFEANGNPGESRQIAHVTSVRHCSLPWPRHCAGMSR